MSSTGGGRVRRGIRAGSPRSGGAPEGVFCVGRVAALPRGRLRDDGMRGERLLGTLRALPHLFDAKQQW